MHLTDAEAQEHRRVQELHNAEFLAWFLPAYGLPPAPACHSWPAPLEGQTLFDWYPDQCAVCDRKDHRLIVDHCHKTGLVRGYLCRSCNWREGRSHFAAFNAYRLQPPAVILGWTYRYDGDNWTDAQPAYWVVETLGPVPDDSAEAAQYLEAAAKLTWEDTVGERDNPLRYPGVGL